MIGNELIGPEIQLQTYASVAYHFGLIDRNQKTHVEEMTERVLEFMHKQEWFQTYKARKYLLDWIQNVTGIATPLDVRSVPYHYSLDCTFLELEISEGGIECPTLATRYMASSPSSSKVTLVRGCMFAGSTIHIPVNIRHDVK